MDAPDLVKLMAELDDEPEDGATPKMLVVRFRPGEWVMRFGDVTADDAAIEVHMGKVIALRANRRGVKYRIAWGDGTRPEWSDGEVLQGLDDDDSEPD